jgi:hypothetical protein
MLVRRERVQHSVASECRPSGQVPGGETPDERPDDSGAVDVPYRINRLGYDFVVCCHFL